MTRRINKKSSSSNSIIESDSHMEFNLELEQLNSNDDEFSKKIRKFTFILQTTMDNKGFRLLIADSSKKDEDAFCLIDGANLIDHRMFSVYNGMLPKLGLDFRRNVIDSNETWHKYDIWKPNTDSTAELY